MAGIGAVGQPVQGGGQSSGQTYRGPFAIMTVLFFMWGFMTVWNDILIPRFKEAFTLNYFKAMLVQFAFFGAYGIGSLIYYIISILPDGSFHCRAGICNASDCGKSIRDNSWAGTHGVQQVEPFAGIQFV